MRPLNELPHKFRVHKNLVSEPISLGNVPVKEDFWRFKLCVQAVRRPISVGSVPVSRLEASRKVRRISVRRPISVGIVPIKLLDWRSRTIIFVDVEESHCTFSQLA